MSLKLFVISGSLHEYHHQDCSCGKSWHDDSGFKNQSAESIRLISTIDVIFLAFVPAALYHKALTAMDQCEMGGDGLQTRSYTFVDECVEGVLR